MKTIDVHHDYIIFAGKTKDDLYPIAAWLNKEDAIATAYRLLDTKVYKRIEIIYMPEDNDDINEVVWSNCGRK